MEPDTELTFLGYSVMQSDGNNFREDIVFDSFDISYRDEDSILDKKFKKQISWDLYYEDFKIISDWKNIAQQRGKEKSNNWTTCYPMKDHVWSKYLLVNENNENDIWYRQYYVL